MKLRDSIRWTVVTLLLSSIMFIFPADHDATAQGDSYPVFLPLIKSSPSPIIPDTTVVLTEDTTQHLESISPDGSVYTFSQLTPELGQVQQGDVIVTGISPNTPVGFLRVVTAVNQNGGQVVLTTVQGTLEDAIQQGELHFSQTLSPSMIVEGSGLEGVELQQGPQGQFFFQLNNVVLYDADGNPDTPGDQVLANGSLAAEMGVDFDLDIGFFEIDTLYFTAWAVESSNLEISAYTASSSLQAEIELISYTLTPFTVQIGPVPVVMVPEIAFVVGVDGEVYVGITTSVTQVLTASVGAGYADDQWGAHNDFSNEFSWTPPEPTAGLQVKGYLGPQLTLELYGVAGPYARAQAYLELEAEFIPTMYWELWGGLELPVGVEVEVLGKTLADFGVTALDERWLLASAGQPPSEVVEIQAGEFWMGCADNDLFLCANPSDELPLHLVNLDTYEIDKYEVTNSQYALCDAAGACDPPFITGSTTRPNYYTDPLYANYPVIWVQWDDAVDYCTWVGMRLPTEAEWEKAARGDGDTRPYPWGTDELDCSLANKFPCTNDTVQVGSYPTGASPFGALDMTGNVSEWVNDWYDADYYSSSPDSNPPGPPTGTDKVLRGGSFMADGLGTVHSRGFANPSTQASWYTGFRCARDAD